MDVDAQAYAALVSSSLAAQRASESGANTYLSEDQLLAANGKLPKSRKPYTITKQRERWSEEEHLRFIEALRLHGRAWRKIEEHIGTKTAVQIRSHAQKFFNKLEKKKEAGEAPDKEEDFTIPPPRPKRKPAKPYPRKDGLSSSGYTGTSQLSTQLTAQQQLASMAPSTQHMGLASLNGLHHNNSSEVTDATVAAVTAAASAAAAAAAAAVVAAAGQEVQTHMQAHPPSCFPFFGMPPSALTQITPSGVSALDQAALLAQHTAAAKAAVMRFGGLGDGAVPAAPGVGTTPAGLGILGDNNGSDRCLVEATGTTDGTHISANAQLRGSDGDSACSRETDNQDTCPSLALDVSWQSKLQHQSLQQQHMGSCSPSAAAARGLSGLQAGGFDPSALQWGMGRCFEGNSSGASAAALAGLQGLQGFNPAQALALLTNPLYMAAADRQYQHAALQAAAAAGLAGVPAGGAAAAATRSGGGMAASSGGGGGGNSMRTKSRRTAPSVNSGSTGNPCGTKRMLEVGSEECMLPAKKAARDLSDTGEECEGMEVSPSSPSIQEKELKAASQPSNTNGNTSGSNESDGSKRRQGTTQGEGSNPTNGNSSGNGYSMKDSNTGTNTGNNGNGTSAFNPVGHHHHHHSHQQPCSASRRTNNYSSNQQQGDRVAARHMHYSSHNAARNAAGEGSNGGNGASGTGLCMRDEGRSSSDLEGPQQQQLLEQQQQEVDDEVMEEPAEGGEEEEEQQQDSEQASHLQALMASLHGMCGNPLMLQQAYGAAAAAAATAQQIVANAMHSHHELPGAAQNHLAAMQRMRQSSSMPVSQGFAPWHGSAASEFGSSGSFNGHSLLHHHLAGGQGHAGASAAAQQQLQLQAAAGLVGLASNWGSSSAASGDGSNNGGLYSTFTQLTAAAAHQHHQAQHPNHYHTHHHHHHHQQQPAAQQRRSGGLLSSMSGGGGAAGCAAAAAAAAGLQQLQQGVGLNSCSLRTNGASRSHAALALGAAAGLSSYSGLEALTRVASAGTLGGSEGTAAGCSLGKRTLSSHAGAAAAAVYAAEEGLGDAGKRQSNTL